MNQTTSQPKPPPEAFEARLNYLFRTTQRQGRIHPLQHLVQSYRADQQAAAAKAPS